jgi:NADH-quinone oxidoreductase subunit L
MISWSAAHVWLIPLLPLAASLLILSLSKERRAVAVGLAVTGMVVALLLSGAAFAWTLQTPGARLAQNFNWFSFGEQVLRIGCVLDPLAAAMLLMITFVGLCIFIFSKGYMAGDKDFSRFFAYLSFFSAAMLGDSSSVCSGFIAAPAHSCFTMTATAAWRAPDFSRSARARPSSRF